MTISCAMTAEADAAYSNHLLRSDGQEDLCFATWSPSTGRERKTSILRGAILPQNGERRVHGNASFEPEYALRAAKEAATNGQGLAFMHSHPGGTGWQGLNEVDRKAEARIANLAREITGLPLLGLTLAGDGSWAARTWAGVARDVAPVPAEAVRVVGNGLSVTFNDSLRPPPTPTPAQRRTVHTWGRRTQDDIARLRVAVAGVGSVGMSIAETLARTGVQHIGVFDFDTVEWINLDRLRGAGLLDAALKRPKIHVARRLLAEASTAAEPQHEFYNLSVCESAGLEHLLDFDLVFSCVDRPWPRQIVNTIAYADLIPVIEGGLAAFQNPDGAFRNAYWSATVVRPGRPCLVCLDQYDPAVVPVERDGSLDDPNYIAGLPPESPLRRRENVAALSTAVTAALLRQFISFVARPSGYGDLGPLRFSARDAAVEQRSTVCCTGCAFPASTGVGDDRVDSTGRHDAAEDARRLQRDVGLTVRAGRKLDDLLTGVRGALTRRLGKGMDVLAE